ncbi:hypothetical protein Rhe02_09360 [Rhizocola hellebori]|uniref:Uncharacterized protein n=1 Tax=Rhizocola hellebori TaxID=1392758 RepID=A0A8J3Q3P1_9ACTN|nr:hypothetical protein [Rhizocola hellebori]GIH02869.1 hypothetical protein Rhe02_09360 [Rhizocola hellebori]
MAIPDGTGSSRLENLLRDLDRMLKQPYAFHVFAADSVNFGVLTTYRQTWESQSYQVGDLVTTMPLAPKEVQRYTTRRVDKRSRAKKEVDENLRTQRTETTDTGRAESEIVEKAAKKSNFQLTANESFGSDETMKVTANQLVAGSQDKESQNTKRTFHENVRKSAQEYRQQHRIEIETTTSSEFEETSFREIQNPNDELTVTYLFYELQRTYRLSERLHGLTPVALVANDVPAPDEIDDSWLVAHDWILRRAILDDSFRPALDYLTKSFVGAEVNIAILESNAEAQKKVVEALGEQVRAQIGLLSVSERDVLSAVQNLGSSEQQQGLLDIVKGIFDPLGIAGTSDTGAVDAAQLMVDYAKEARDRADRERARLLDQFTLAVSGLQVAIDRLSASVREHYDNVAAIDRLRVHVKDNILYYMQAVWSHEPPDQRFFRLYNIDVPMVEFSSEGITVDVIKGGGSLADDLLGRDFGTVELPLPKTTVVKRKLADVADLDEVLGFKGNYTIFALKENNYLTLRMMQDYFEVGDDLVLRDPDEFGELTVEQLAELATCLHKCDPQRFEARFDQIRAALIDKLASPRAGSDFVIVPTSSLYIEALVGTHPLLEDFKLIHRALDVKKVQADVRRQELENLRLARRLFAGKDDDPDIDKNIVVTEGTNLTLETD